MPWVSFPLHRGHSRARKCRNEMEVQRAERRIGLSRPAPDRDARDVQGNAIGATHVEHRHRGRRAIRMLE
jgi:hypothetical protein